MASHRKKKILKSTELAGVGGQSHVLSIEQLQNKNATTKYIYLIIYFDSIEEIKTESLKALKAIPKEDFAKCFDDWKIRWHKCIAVGGDYFEGDEIDLEQ